MQVVVGFIVVPAVSLVSPKIERETVDNIFRCYDVEVEATTKKVLPEEKESWKVRT